MEQHMIRASAAFDTVNDMTSQGTLRAAHGHFSHGVGDEISSEWGERPIGSAAPRGMVIGLGLSLLLWSGIALALVWVGV
jgi:hypothetical protein